MFGLELQQVFITVEHSELFYPGVSTGHKEQYTIFVWGVNRQGQRCHLKTAGHQHLLTSAEQVQHHLRVNFLKITFPHSFVLKCWSSQLVPNCPDFVEVFYCLLRILFQCPFLQQVLDATNTVLVQEICTDSNVLPAINVTLIV